MGNNAGPKVSKNQRAGVKQKPRVRRCRAGHEPIRVKVVPVKGSARFEWRCPCDGYIPMVIGNKA